MKILVILFKWIPLILITTTWLLLYFDGRLAQFDWAQWGLMIVVSIGAIIGFFLFKVENHLK